MKRSAARVRLLASLVATIGALAGCDRVQHARLTGVMDERDANQIIATLERVTGNMQITKEQPKKGGEWVIYVPAELLQDARAVIDFYELPRRARATYERYPAQSGIMVSEREDRARAQAALGGNIEMSILALDGVINAEVTVNLPLESSYDPTEISQPTASAVVRYAVDRSSAAAASQPSLQEQVRSLVAKSVPALQSDKVSVTLVPLSLRLPSALRPASAESAGDSAIAAATPPADVPLLQLLLRGGVVVLGVAVVGLISYVMVLDRKLRTVSRSETAKEAVAV